MDDGRLVSEPNRKQAGPSLFVEASSDGPIGENKGFSSGAFKDIEVVPTMKPPGGFVWQFLSGTWVMVPDIVVSSAGVDNSTGREKDFDCSDAQSLDKAAIENDVD